MATSLSDIQAKIKALQEEEAKLIEAEKSDVIQVLKEKIAAYNITFKELGFVAPIVRTAAKSKAVTTKDKPVIMYRKSDNETWSGGRGKRPLWVSEIFEQAGKDDQKFREAMVQYLVKTDVPEVPATTELKEEPKKKTK